MDKKELFFAALDKGLTLKDKLTHNVSGAKVHEPHDTKKYFSIVGTDYVQDDKLTGQEIIDRLLLDKNEEFCECEYKKTRFEGKKAIKIYAVDTNNNSWHIGWIPKDRITQFIELTKKQGYYLRISRASGAFIHFE